MIFEAAVFSLAIRIASGIADVTVSSLKSGQGVKVLCEQCSYWGLPAISAGDFNADGYEDLFVDHYVIFGNKDMAGVQLDRLGEASGFTIAEESIQAAASGDINGDGLPDLVLGSPFGWNTAYEDHETYVIFGTSSYLGDTFDPRYVNGSDGFKLIGTSGDYLGSHVTTGDFNGDGYSDIIASAPGFIYNKNRVYVVFGGDEFPSEIKISKLDAPRGLELVGSRDEEILEVVSGGDLNGDGKVDIAIRTRRKQKYNIYVLYGSTKLAGKVRLAQIEKKGWGFVLDVKVDSMAIVDLNRDGFYDLAMGIPTAANGAGQIFVAKGSRNGIDSGLSISNFKQTDGFKITGVKDANVASGAGERVKRAGDVNGDGIDDLIVTARAEGNYASYAYIVFGNINMPHEMKLANLDGSNGFRIFESEEECAAGDINGDGYDDVFSSVFYPSTANADGTIVFGSK